MKKKIGLIIIFIIIISCTYLIKEKTAKREFDNYQVYLSALNLNIKEKDNCIKEKVLYHEEDGLKYYTSCLENITDNNGKDLKSLLDAGKITFADIFSTYKDEVITYYDGGSKEYYFDNLTILKCHTIEENYDVIIGAPITSIGEGYCSADFDKENVGYCSFKKTYLIKDKAEKADDEHTYIIVEDSNGVDAKVKVKDYVIRGLEFGKEHVLNFDNRKELIKDDRVEDIFNNYRLSSYGTKDSYSDDEETDQKVCMPVSRDLLKKAYLFLSKEKQSLIKHYDLAETDYKTEKIITVYNKKGKAKNYKDVEIIIVKFIKDVPKSPHVISVVIDFKTKEVLGTLPNN